MEQLFLVAIGGMLGAVSRYCVTLAVAAALGSRFPFATLAANIIGCLLAGLVMGGMEARGANEQLRLLLIVGFAGGLTTFSAFHLDTLGLWQGQGIFWALANVCANLLLAFLAMLAGFKISKIF
jgi:CrcB protein